MTRIMRCHLLIGLGMLLPMAAWGLTFNGFVLAQDGSIGTALSAPAQAESAIWAMGKAYAALPNSSSGIPALLFPPIAGSPYYFITDSVFWGVPVDLGQTLAAVAEAWPGSGWQGLPCLGVAWVCVSSTSSSLASFGFITMTSLPKALQEWLNSDEAE